MHQIVIMRLTINLEEDLYNMARAHSVAEGISISKAVNALLRLRHNGKKSSRQDKGSDRVKEAGLHQESGFPVSKSRCQKFPANAVIILNEEEDEKAYRGI